MQVVNFGTMSLGAVLGGILDDRAAFVRRCG
jgi:hypothetical protein